ncbi:MAG: four helix bundle suffix domain-containing protein [Alloprevotella sp.]|nr:four helix bundle suffix domain-containing protein [Alloprevotella sp.]MBR1652141.1 four helix bundle suffix domain-containing protein [Alloprevotella sp.]MBR1653195.1 four helix bundle suffix domain-containing protein [Alloprevotella sp.]
MESKQNPEVRHYADGTASVLRPAVVYTDLRFYQRSDVLYQLTQQFCQRFLPRYGDRTVDQMVQAARSTKQNIAEGSSDAQTSAETELKLLGIARGSNQELLEDYQDYLKRKGFEEWHGSNPRFDKLHAFCKRHSRYEDYRGLLPRMNDEELANTAICLCHQVDSALTKYIARKDREFTTEGGIRERMTAARLGQRETQRQIIERQRCEIAALREECAALREQLAKLTGGSGYPGEPGNSGNPG